MFSTKLIQVLKKKSGEEGGRNAKGRESTLGCRRSQLVNHEVVPPVPAEVGSGRPRESTGCGARLGCGPAPLQVAFAKDVRYRGHELGVAEGLVAVQVGLRVVDAKEFRRVESQAFVGTKLYQRRGSSLPSHRLITPCSDHVVQPGRCSQELGS